MNIKTPRLSSWDSFLAKVEQEQQRIENLKSNVLPSNNYRRLIKLGRLIGISPSRLSYYVNKLYLFAKYFKYVRKLKGQDKDFSSPPEWISFSKLAQKDEDFVELARLSGPRWNCFALIGTVLAFKVKRTLEIDTSQLSSDSESWSLVVYNKKRQTVTKVSSVDPKSDHKISLDPGLYQVVYRYYPKNNQLVCPKLTIDEALVIDQAVFPKEKQAYEECLQKVAAARHPLYLLQQFYVFDWLKNREIIDSEKIKQAFLPVGDPNNVFDYGYVSKSEDISVTITEDTLSDYQVYLAYYNELSLPVFWTRITKTSWSHKQIEEDGAYLIRFVRKTENSDKKLDFQVLVTSEINANNLKTA
jgi:hypothetical protein